MKIRENKKFKILNSPDYNFFFNKITGEFLRTGKTPHDNPFFSPFGPELLDIEISTICHQGCAWCYKSNTTEGQNMSLETFKKVLSVIPKEPLTQIAFGIGSIDANPYLWDILIETRAQGIVPNITINGSRLNPEGYLTSKYTDAYVNNLADLCGAVAVSNYNKEICYNAVKRLVDAKKRPNATLKQVNIHQLLSMETLDKCRSLLDDMEQDPRLEELNAAVFLLLKPKGGRNNLTSLKDLTVYREFVNSALDRGLNIGFDSCTAPSFLRATKDRPNYSQLETLAEACESTLFSLYIDVEGKTWPCSFCEGEKDFQGKSLLNINTEEEFLNAIWLDHYSSFRHTLQESENTHGCRQCPVFDIEIDQ